MLGQRLHFNSSAWRRYGSDALVEMWHISRQLNLHLYGYALEKTHLIRSIICAPVLLYQQLINLFDFLASLPLSKPHLQPITAPLSAEKKSSKDQ
jgi:hypothetical protein